MRFAYGQEMYVCQDFQQENMEKYFNRAKKNIG